MGLARELGSSGITVNAIAPGVADTAMTQSHLSEDVADLVCFLASERAGYITGTVIPIDGGILTT